MNLKTGISLFSGCGGDTLGMEMAGIEVKGYVEIDSKACDTHDINFPNCDRIGTDIYDVQDSDWSRYEGKIDIVFGGFPCQSFSHAGKKKSNDKRGLLYLEFVRCVSIVQPAVILGENVKGILTRKNHDGSGWVVDEIIKSFEDTGYTMSFTVLNTKDFGICQDRQRVIFWGVRDDILKELNVNMTPNINIKSREPKFLRDIIDTDSLNRAIEIKVEDVSGFDRSLCLKTHKNREDIYGEPPLNLTKCLSQKKISMVKRSSPEHSCAVSKNDVSRTLICTYSRMPRLFVPLIHDGNDGNDPTIYLRPYTKLEMMRIQGFPDSFIFIHNDFISTHQIGNAIAPILVRDVCLYISSSVWVIERCVESNTSTSSDIEDEGDMCLNDLKRISRGKTKSDMIEYVKKRKRILKRSVK